MRFLSHPRWLTISIVDRLWVIRASVNVALYAWTMLKAVRSEGKNTGEVGSWLHLVTSIPPHITSDMCPEWIHPRMLSQFCSMGNIYEYRRKAGKRIAERLETWSFEDLPGPSNTIGLSLVYDCKNLAVVLPMQCTSHFYHFAHDTKKPTMTMSPLLGPAAMQVFFARQVRIDGGNDLRHHETGWISHDKTNHLK